MTEAETLRVIVEAAARIGEIPAAQLRDRTGSDLVHDFGVDSIRMMRIWVEIEKGCGLEPGDLAFTQQATVAGLVEQVLAATCGATPPEGHRTRS